MSRRVRKWIQPAVATMLVIFMLSPGRVFAWQQGYPNVYAPHYQPYSQMPYSYFTGPGSRIGPRSGSVPGPGSVRGYGYTQPKWFIRGRVNRFGDYRIDVRLRGVSQQDMYYAWLLYNSMGFNR